MKQQKTSLRTVEYHRGKGHLIAEETYADGTMRLVRIKDIVLYIIGEDDE